MSAQTPRGRDAADEDIKIEYLPEGRVPAAIWLLWGAYLVYATYYISTYAWPDFIRWMSEAKLH